GGIFALGNQLVKLGLTFLFILLLAGLGFSAGFSLCIRLLGSLHEGHGVALSFERGRVIGHDLERFTKRFGSILVMLAGHRRLSLFHDSFEIGGLFLSFFLLARFGVCCRLGSCLGFLSITQ